MSEHGFLVLADISGFTRFLAGTALEHGPRVIADLLGTVAAQLSPPLEIQEIEGDAVFTLGSEQDLAEPATLLAIVERAFIAFKQRQREMVLDVACTCQACSSIPSLNVKFIGHYGSFIRQSIAGRAQVSGSDVIVVHRLLKNRVEGSRGYLLLTEPASIRAGQDPNDPAIRSHVEELDALGQVRCSVRDLDAVWRQLAETTVVRVAPEEALLRVEVLLPAPPPVVWDWLFSPEKRQRFEGGVRRVVQESGADAQVGVGTRYQCDHGPTRTLETIRDWRPFRYCTRDVTRRPGNLTLRVTIDLEPTEDRRTRLTVLGAPPPSASWWKRLVLRAIAPRIAAGLEVDLRTLATLLSTS